MAQSAMSSQRHNHSPGAIARQANLSVKTDAQTRPAAARPTLSGRRLLLR